MKTDERPGMVRVPEKELKEMQERLRWLDALEGAGVDNWSGYDYAAELFDEEEDNTDVQ